MTTDPILQGTTISHESPLSINGVETNFGSLYSVVNGTAGVGNGTTTFTDATGKFTSGMTGSTMNIPSQNLRVTITYVSATQVTTSIAIATGTGIVWYLDTTLSNLALTAVSMNVKFVNAGTWYDTASPSVKHTFAAGDYAFTCDTLTSLGTVLYTPTYGATINGVWCTLFTDQSTPVSTIVEGLPGLYLTGIKYQMEVSANKYVGGVLQATRIIGTYDFTVFAPQV